MAIADDILYDEVNHRFYGESTFLAGTSYYTMNQFYAHAIDIEDNPSNMDAEEFFTLDANQLTYKTNGGLYVQQELLEHLTSASLETTGYTDEVYLLTFNSGGYTSAIASDIGKAVVGGTTGDTGVLLDYDNTQRKWWVRADTGGSGGDEFDVSEAITITSGTGAGTTTAASVTGEELFTNLRSIGAVASGNPYLYRGTLANVGDVVTSWWGEGNYDGNGDTAPNDYHVDILVKAKEGGSLINSGNVILFNRNWGDTFSHATASLSGGGVVTVALSTQTDSSITLTTAQAEDLTDGTTGSISVSFAGPFSADVNDDDVDETYIFQVDNDSFPSSLVYQALQWMLYKDSTTTLNGFDGESYTLASGTFTPLPAAPLGQLSAGTLLYAQGGYPINTGDNNYQSQDSAGATYSPPASISVGFSSGLVSGDYCGVFEKTGSGANDPIDKAQYTVGTANLGGTTVQMSANLGKDTPSSGKVRLRDPASGEERIHRYSSWATDTLTLTTPDTGTVTTANAAGTTLIDSAATFVTTGIVQGDVVRNTTDGSYGVVKSVDSETQLTLHKQLEGGTDNDFDSSDAYSINSLDRDWDALSATAYIGWLDGIAGGSSYSTSVQFVSVLNLRYVVRNSSSGSSNKIKRFRQDAQATSAGGTIPAARNPETLVS